MRKLNVRWLGKLPYSEAYDLQVGLHKSVASNLDNDDYLLLLEHENVITSGRTSKSDSLLVPLKDLENMKIDFFETDRGGDITFHGEGQLIGYPIIRLEDPKKVVPFVRLIEEVLIDTLEELSIDSFTKEDDTGVWTENGKIASIGIKVSKWTTYHGFSLNIFDKLEGFELINPCGNELEKITSIQNFNQEVSFDEVSEIISKNFAKSFQYLEVDKQFSQFTPKQLKSRKEFNIDKMVANGVFRPTNKGIPITIRGVLPSEPRRPEWMKVKANLGNDWGRSHESILHFRKSKKFIFNIDEARIPYNDHTLKYPRRTQADTSQYSNGKQKEYIWEPHPKGAKPKDVFEIPTISNGAWEKQPHLTQKPVELLRKIILSSSNQDSIILDPFGGSGTTFAVAEAYNRRWLGTELDLSYCNTIKSRLQDSDHLLRIANAKDTVSSNNRRKKLRG